MHQSPHVSKSNCKDCIACLLNQFVSPPPICLNHWLQCEGQGIQVLGLHIRAQDSRSIFEILLATAKNGSSKSRMFQSSYKIKNGTSYQMLSGHFSTFRQQNTQPRLGIDDRHQEMSAEVPAGREARKAAADHQHPAPERWKYPKLCQVAAWLLGLPNWLGAMDSKTSVKKTKDWKWQRTQRLKSWMLVSLLFQAVGTFANMQLNIAASASFILLHITAALQRHGLN